MIEIKFWPPSMSLSISPVIWCFGAKDEPYHVKRRESSQLAGGSSVLPLPLHYCLLLVLSCQLLSCPNEQPAQPKSADVSNKRQLSIPRHPGPLHSNCPNWGQGRKKQDLLLCRLRGLMIHLTGVRMGHSNTNSVARSSYGDPIPIGER